MVSSSPLPLSISTLLIYPPPPPDTRGISLNHISDHVTVSCLRNQFPPFSTTGFLSLGILDIEGQMTVGRWGGAVLYIAECLAASLVSPLLPLDASRTSPVVGRIMSHHTLIPGTCEFVKLHGKGNLRLQMELKVANQLT